jgi:hypothetical protein
MHIPNARWKDDENRLVVPWLRWFLRYRRVRRLAPRRTALAGLQEDLENIGSHRTRKACEHHLFLAAERQDRY